MVSAPRSALRRRVLIVDRSEESREVLRTVLERRGLDIFEATEARQGLELARKHRPEVVVLDEESESANDELRGEYDAASGSLVVIGSVRRPEGDARHRYVAKPYHFGPLIQAIEQMAQSCGQHTA